jgi:thiol-disulfide isomerase/thioredoxin
MVLIRHRPHRLWALLPGLLVLFAACGTPETARQAEAGVADGVQEEAGERLAPEFEMTDLEGRSVRLSDSHGKVRLIDFWATWCPPCRDEIPMLNALHEAYGGQGLEIIAVTDESVELMQSFLEEHEMKYANLIGTADDAMNYGVMGLPTAFLVDAEGRIVDDFFGPKPKSVLEKKIRELLELPPAT